MNENNRKLLPLPLPLQQEQQQQQQQEQQQQQQQQQQLLRKSRKGEMHSLLKERLITYYRFSSRKA